MKTSTEDVFDQIAPAWYNFRPWSIFTHELEVVAKRGQKRKLLNLGCGHGPDFLALKIGIKLDGVHVSPPILKPARRH